MPKYKSIAVTCIILFSLFLSVCGCSKREIVNIDSRGETIVCFGDSITFGYGVGRNEDYPYLLSQMVAIPVINAGIDGDTSIDALARLESDALSKKPLLVIIEFGGNDFLKKVPVDETVKNVREMTRKVHAQGAMAAIVDISAGMLLKDYRSAFLRLAREEGALYIPGALSGIITNPNLKSDFMHPNNEGYRLVAWRIHRIIAPCLQKNLLCRKPAGEE